MRADFSSIPKSGPVVAIDGPAGTGKSSTTRRLAEVLGFTHIDTGAMYRSIALLIREKSEFIESLDSMASLAGLPVAAEAVRLSDEVKLEFKRMPKRNPSNRIFANGRDVTDLIRSPEVSMAASRISAIPGVRQTLSRLQRELGCNGKAILEGRDIGTVVFPDADVKFYLTASVEERAKRRLAELEAAGADVSSYEDLKAQIVTRDHEDSSRAVAPLRRAEDAILVDTSNLAFDEVVQTIERSVRENLGIQKFEKGKIGL